MSRDPGEVGERIVMGLALGLLFGRIATNSDEADEVLRSFRQDLTTLVEGAHIPRDDPADEVAIRNHMTKFAATIMRAAEFFHDPDRIGEGLTFPVTEGGVGQIATPSGPSLIDQFRTKPRGNDDAG